MNLFRVNLVVDWEHQIVQLQDPPHGTMRWIIQFNPYNIARGDDHMAITITDNQKFKVSIQPVDAKGNPARVDGVPFWAVGDMSILANVTADDGMSAEIFALGPLGTTQVTVTADADLGEGIKEITGILDVTVIGGEAVALTISTGVPEEQLP